MKKLLMLMAIAAMASGAWATDYAFYKFSLTIFQIPNAYDHLSADAKIYLIDTSSGNSIIAYGAAKDWDSQDHKLVSKDVTSHIQTGTVTFSGYDDTVYTYTEHTLKQGSLITDVVRAGDKDVTFGLNFTTTSAEMSKLGSLVDGKKTGEAANLIAIVYDDKFNEGTSTFYQKFTGTTFVNQSSTPEFQVGGAFIPEPTSGLLVLLGVAGLALRRRKAA